MSEIQPFFHDLKKRFPDFYQVILAYAVVMESGGNKAMMEIGNWKGDEWAVCIPDGTRTGKKSRKVLSEERQRWERTPCAVTTANRSRKAPTKTAIAFLEIVLKGFSSAVTRGYSDLSPAVFTAITR